ncbi:MAG: helix-turn-helix domain-containing protein [Sedimentisphaerales bacterium]|nr:helix-turn-helix domain-containing protein [Sedimentisphaerales bacterium]
MQTIEPLLLSFAEASDLLNISRTLLYGMHSDGRLGPIPHKIGRRSLLCRKEIEKWVDAGMPTREKWLEMRRNL